MAVSLKYAVVERERRFLIGSLPDWIATRRTIVDRYLIGTRLRLREMHDEDGTITRKLTHKVRLGSDPSEVACTNMYVDDAEWDLLAALPAHVLSKTRHLVLRDGVKVAIDGRARHSRRWSLVRSSGGYRPRWCARGGLRPSP